MLARQYELLAHLVFAQENADRLQHGLFRAVDWETLLASVHQAQANDAAYLARLDAALQLIEPAAPPPPRPRQSPPETFRVVFVPDGDGLRLEDGRRVRYIGIDAPELHTCQGSAEPFADKAAAYNRRLVLGKRVRLERDVS